MIKGHLIKQQRRCDKCNRLRPYIYIVNEGPTTGAFCSPFCYQAAKEHMEGGHDGQQKKQ